MISMPCSNSSQTCGDVDGLAFGQRHDRLLHVFLLADKTAETLGLAEAAQSVNCRHLDAEQGFDSGLDLWLGSRQGNIEDNLVMLGNHGGLFGDRRRDDHVVMATIRQLKRSSRASTAALESTSLPRRRMS